jgi:hypothetical protein
MAARIVYLKGGWEDTRRVQRLVGRTPAFRGTELEGGTVDEETQGTESEEEVEGHVGGRPKPHTSRAVEPTDEPEGDDVEGHVGGRPKPDSARAVDPTDEPEGDDVEAHVGGRPKADTI